MNNDRQIKISEKLLHELLAEAYQSGWYGVLELDEETADNIIERRITEEMVVKPLPPPPSLPMPFVGVGQPLLIHGIQNLPQNINWLGGGGPSNIVISSGNFGSTLQVPANIPNSDM